MTSARLIALVVVLVASTAAADPPCKPSAQLSGEAAVVAAVEVVLRGRGIEVSAVSTDAAFVDKSCRRVTADVTTGGGRIMVWVTDADGRRAQRMAEDTEAAATVIESWARGDLVDPLLASRGVLELGTSGAARVVATPAPARPRYLLLAGGDVGVSGDGALWTGAHAHGCGMIGAFCIGGTFRFGYDTQQSGDTAELETGRTAFGLTFTVERPIRRGAFVFSPGAGVGLTSISATYPAEDELEQASTVHFRAGLAGAYEFTHAWSLRVDLEAEVSPTARNRLGEPDGVDHQLAASPTLQSWFGVSVVYGGP